MDNQTIHDKFRYQLTNVHALTVLTVTIFEIVGYIVLVISGVEFFSLKNYYLWYGVVFPIVVNFLTHFIARKIISNSKYSRKIKNNTIIIAALITSLIVSVIHKEYIVTSCAFIFPIILSAMFNDKKLLNFCFIASIFVLIMVGLAFWLDKSINLTCAINLAILFGFSFVSYLCANISINFSKQNYTAIESQAAQNNKLLQAVLKDQMTGLYNHTSFLSHLDSEISSYSDEISLCMVMVDVDDFKYINDTYGHDCGDIVLTQLAKTLEKYCSENDTAYRYGGEEFAIVFFDKSTTKVQKIVKEILDEFKNYKFSFTSKKITFSAGVAQYKKGQTKEEFFEEADKTLYKAKREGKNCVLISEMVYK